MAARNTYFQDEVIEKKIDLKQLLRTIKYIKPHAKQMLAVMLMLILSSVVSLIPPIVLKKIIDVAVPEGDYKRLAIMLAAMVGLALIEIGVTYIQTRFMGTLGHTIISELREDVFAKLQKLPFDYFDNRPNGKIVVRVTEYINGLADFFTNFFMMFFIYIIKIVVVTVFMLTYSPLLTLVVLLTVIPMMAIVFLIRYRIRKLFSVHRAKISNRTAFLIESIMGEKIVKNYNRVDLNEQIHMNVHMDSVHQWEKIYPRINANTPIVETFWNIGSMVIYGVALYLILRGDSTINAGLVILFTQYMTQFSGPLQQIAGIIQNLAQVSSNLEQVFDTLDQPVKIKDEENAVTLKNARGKVDFNNITFAYEEGVNVLENFDLHVTPGETIALIGPTGGGKTTIISMLTRFYDVNEGSVCIDDTDVRTITLSSLRKEVGVLMQDPFLFKGSVMENIRYGRPDATDEECIKAAETIYADPFIRKLSGGYEHQIVEGGNDLSSGEKQLICFARIILKNPSIIILDEATSSIDTETESLIQKALDTLIKGKTAFIVAHRLSTVRSADRILFIKDKGIQNQTVHEG